MKSRDISKGFFSTLPHDAFAWAYAALLVFISIDVFARTDWPVEIATLFFLGAVLYKRAWAFLPPALLLFFLYPAGHFYPSWIWKVPGLSFLIPFLLSFLACLPFPELRRRFFWFRAGRLDQIVWFLVALTGLIASLALVLWALWTDYFGVATQMVAPLKDHSRWLLLFGLVPVFALVNAAVEEIVYRGVLQEGLEESWGSTIWVMLVLQASAFAAAHYGAGFPNGKIGYLMVFVYAMMLGWLRRRSGGILAPYVAHVVADAVIGITLVLLAT